MTASLRAACRLIAVLGVLAVAVLPSPASAHATLTGSTPRAGQHLERLPSEVRFEFSQEMSAPAYVIVTAPDGTSIAQGDPVVEGRVVSQAIGEGSDGTYTMAYRTVSKDGHPVTGEITFTVGAGTSPAPGSATPAPSREAGAEAGSEKTAEVTEAAGPDDGDPSREAVAVIGAGALFAAAGALLLLARRMRP